LFHSPLPSLLLSPFPFLFLISFSSNVNMHKIEKAKNDNVE
jgi:hypothetical protein